MTFSKPNGLSKKTSKPEDSRSPGNVVPSRSAGNLPNQVQNRIKTTLSNPSMSASYPSTSETNIFITPAIGRHKFVAGLDRSPKKSILKRPHSYGPSSQSVAFESAIPRFIGRPNSESIFDYPEDVSPRSQQKLTVGFSEKNTVAIFGDTSDDNTTETESDPRLAAAVAAANLAASKIPVKIVRQTSILSSEEDTDSPSQPMMDSHENTPFEDDDILTEDLEIPKNEKKELHRYPKNEKKELHGYSKNEKKELDEFSKNELYGYPENEKNELHRYPENEKNELHGYPEIEKTEFDELDEFSKIEKNELDDGEISASSNASSIIAGKWWFGKDTRYVVHCDKKNCNHKHQKSEFQGPYLTPTQQKNKEIIKLKKELKIAKNESDEKEKNLKELREKIKEIENLINKNTNLKEYSRLMKRQKEIQEEFKTEKKELIKKHDLRIQQLVQEALEARNELFRKSQQFENFTKFKKNNLIDAEMNTDLPQIQNQGQNVASLAPSPNPGDPEEDKDVQIFVAQETVNQIQACQNEAIVWRTKAAQLEIIVKDHLSKTSIKEKNLLNELEIKKIEIEKLREYCHKLEASALADSIIEGDRVGMIKSMDSGHSVLTSQNSVALVLAAECQSPACAERTRLLNEENKQIIEALEEKSENLRSLEEITRGLKQVIEQNTVEIDELKIKQKEISNICDERESQIEAAQLVVSRLQKEKDQLNQALSFLEEKIQLYRNTILDHDLVLKDESTEDWRRGFSDPRFSVFFSKQVQTDLTSDELTNNEKDFVDLHEKFKKVQAEFSSKNKSLHEKFAEIEENLILKTNLVESLSRQLESAQIEIQASHDLRQKERETYQGRIDALGKVAERISFLETEHERLKTEKSQLELKFEEIKKEYEEGLEDALEGTLKKYRQQSAYWQARISQVEKIKNEALAQVEKIKKEIEIIKLKNNLNKADLEQRLTSSIDHVTVLNDQMNVPRRDAQCDARPKQSSKYVSCKPNVKDKDSQIEKGDIFDEVEERLKLTQAELGITKRQVQVLQQKFFECSGDTPRPSPGLLDNSVKISKINKLEKKTELEEANLEDLKENLIQLESRNSELTSKLRQLEIEKKEQKLIEKERIQQLVTEFDNVRKELDDEIMKYENNRKKMKEKIKILENEKNESKKLKFKLKQWNKLNKILHNPRSSLTSETDDSEVEKAIEKFEEKLNKEKIQKSASFPTLLVTSADSDSEAEINIMSDSEQRNYITVDETEKSKIFEELNRLKLKVEQSIRRAISNKSKNSESGTSGFRSPEFRNPESENSESRTSGFKISGFRTSESDNSELRSLEFRNQEFISPEFRNREFKTSESENSELRSPELRNQEFKTSESENSELRSPEFRNQEFKTSESENSELRSPEFRNQEFKTSESENSEFKTSEFRSPELRNQESKNLRSKTLESSELTPRMEKSPFFKNVNSDLGQVQEELQKILENLENELPKKSKISKKKEIEQELNDLKKELIDLRTDYKGANAELEMYRSEIITNIKNKNKNFKFKKFKSCENLTTTSADPDELRKWKETAGTTLREINRLRKETNLSRIEARDLRTQLDILRGELALSRALEKLANEKIKNKKIKNQKRSSSVEYSIPKKDFRRTSLQVESTIEPPSESEVKKEPDSKTEINNLSQKISQLEKSLEEKEIQIRRQKLSRQPFSKSDEAILEKFDKDQIKNEEIISRKLELYEKKIREIEEEKQQMYLVMFKKGQQAAKHDIEEDKKIDEMTEDKITLKFLHDAFYYYLQNKGSTREHLHAIMTMLNFTSAQKDEIFRRRGNSH